MKKDYQVGQVLFVVLAEQNKILPCQIVERTTRQTLNGVDVVHKVRFGTEEENVMELHRVKGEVFDTIDEVRISMLEKVTAFVNRHVEQARKAAQTWYKTPGVPTVQDIQTVPVEPEETNLVELPDGTLVKAKISGLPT